MCSIFTICAFILPTLLFRKWEKLPKKKMTVEVDTVTLEMSDGSALLLRSLQSYCTPICYRVYFEEALPLYVYHSAVNAGRDSLLASALSNHSLVDM